MSWNVKYVFLILFTTLVSYYSSILLEKTADQKKKKGIIAITAVLCLGVLFFFKYFNFVSQSISKALKIFAVEWDPFLLKVLLPVGISFYTFQTLSYVIDVYRGDVKAERHFGYYATFVSFFPQLVAGPIERTNNLLPQIKAIHFFDYNQGTYGLKLMAWGYFKKIVIADTLSTYVSKVYNSPQNYTGFALVLATVFFAFQIYCDFSGYSDIAIGVSKLFGIDLMTNFKSPYFSQNIKEFWSRWHISLSTWFKDYVYIPLGGNRVSKLRRNFNLLTTFLVSGLWHGANWNFVIWGGIHGIAQILETSLLHKRKVKTFSFVWIIKVCITFTFSSFAWIFFVSNSLSDAVYVISNMFAGITEPIAYLRNGFVSIGMDRWAFALAVGLLSILACFDLWSLKTDVIYKIEESKGIIKWTIFIILILMIVFLSKKGVATEFVYFQF